VVIDVQARSISNRRIERSLIDLGDSNLRQLQGERPIAAMCSGAIPQPAADRTTLPEEESVRCYAVWPKGRPACECH
jgi:hypothetical protein